MTTTNTPIRIAVDISQDMFDGNDETILLLRHIANGDEPAQEIDGILVTEDNVDDLLDAYVAAWEAAWLATAERLGHEAIAAFGGSPEWHDWVGSNPAEYLSREETGWTAVEEAWQQVWDECPHVSLADALDQ